MKPANIFLCRNDAGGFTPTIIDFGIAKVVAGDHKRLVETEAGAVVGTMAYMSPEQIQNSRDVDARTDIWSMGVILYRLLSGRLPFEAASALALVAPILTAAPTPITAHAPALPAAVAATVHRALEKSPDRRWQSMRELLDSLLQRKTQAFRQGSVRSLPATSPSSPALAPQPPRTPAHRSRPLLRQSHQSRSRLPRRRRPRPVWRSGRVPPRLQRPRVRPRRISPLPLPQAGPGVTPPPSPWAPPPWPSRRSVGASGAGPPPRSNRTAPSGAATTRSSPHTAAAPWPPTSPSSALGSRLWWR